MNEFLRFHTYYKTPNSFVIEVFENFFKIINILISIEKKCLDYDINKSNPELYLVK